MSPGLLKTPNRRLLITLLVMVGLGMGQPWASAQHCTLEEIRFPAQVNERTESPLSVACRLAQTHTLSFRKAFQTVVDQATNYLLGLERSGNDAVVLDLDETLMDNRAYFLVYEAYDAGDWADWVRLAEAPAIPETLDFVRWLTRNDYKVYFVSGRKEAWRGVTEENLRAMGVPPWEGLFLKADDYDRNSAADFKIEARRTIEAKGQRVVLTMGDQESDLRGGYGEGFLLPNPIYFIP